MVASRQVETPYYRAVGRQRGRGFGALAQVIGRTAIPFLRKYIVPAAKRIGADMLEFAAPEIARKQLGERERSRRRTGSRKKTASRIIPLKSTKQSSRSRRDISTNISR